jgi:DNA topoisomerase-1
VFASVASVDELFTITLEQALERIRNKNRRPVLRELGPHPETGLPLVICKGRYGPYVTDGKVNGTIGRDSDPEEITVADAVALLAAAAERAAQGGGRPARGRRVTKATAGRSTGKKTVTKKTVTKKTVTKKTVTRKATSKKATSSKPAAKKATSARAARKPAAGPSGSGSS